MDAKIHLPPPDGRGRYQAKRKKKQRTARTMVLIGLVLVLLVVILALVSLLTDSPADTVPAAKQQEGTVTITAVGDIHMDQALLDAGRTDNGYDFAGMFLGVAPTLAKSDITVGNLECSYAGPAATDKAGWAPDELADNLAALGFDVLQTANSYAITGGLEGLTRSMETVEFAGMRPVGTSATKQDYKDDRAMVEIEVNGMRVVFVAFTKGLNNMSLPADTDYAVNLLYSDYDTNYAEIDRKGIETVMKAARQRDPDVLVAMVHWGVENDRIRSDTQEAITDLLILEGADAILGSHSHLVSTLEERSVVNDKDETMSAFVAYDLGEFCSGDGGAGIALQLEFTRDKEGQVTLSKYLYTPLYQVHSPDSNVAQYQVWDSRLAMELYEQGYAQRVSREDYDAIARSIDSIKEAVTPEEPEE